MKNLSINMKLIVGFGIILMIMLVSLGLSMYSNKTLSTQIDLYSDQTVPNMVNLWTMRRNLVSAQRNLLRGFVEDDSKKMNEHLMTAENDGKELLACMDAYLDNITEASLLAQMKEARTKAENAGVVRRQITELLRSSTEEDHKNAKELFDSKYVPLFDEIADILIGCTARETEKAEAQDFAAKNAESLAWILIFSAAIVSVIITIIVIFTIRRSIIKPVKEIEQVYAEISKGNMQADITYESKDELGSMAKYIKKTNAMLASYINDISEKLSRMAEGDMRIQVELDYIGDFKAIKDAMEKMASSLSHALHTINTAAEQVNTGAAQVAVGAQTLAAGSSEQAASVEELNASIAAIANQANENSEHVKLAAHYVEQAVENVKDSSLHMGQLNESMMNIADASDQITSITKVIEDIAFQTNILALNAAIEAARAGNAGKGFAVVADEVRSLAAKSAEAAKKTAELIQHSVATVAEGTQAAEKASQMLKSVEEKANLVNESIIKIDHSSGEQAIAIENIRQSLTQVSAVIQTNAATAEENSATSEEMSAQAATLKEEVGRFKLIDDYDMKRRTDLLASAKLPAAEKKDIQDFSNFGKY